jgi:iron(III) transport system ATP-binding protein
MMGERAAAVAVEDMDVRYGAVAAVLGASLAVPEGERHVLLGQSGSGKTTLLRAIAGLEPIARGRVRLGGETVEEAGRLRLAPERRGVGIVFQDYALFPHLSVGDNVAFGRRDAGPGAVASLLFRVGLEGLERRMPAELSGGQQQRVALARALAHEPRVLLLDEPFSNVDKRRRRDLRHVTVSALAAAGVTAIFVTHDVEEAFALADRLSVMADGRILQTGTSCEVYEQPADETVARALGEIEVLPATAIDGGRAASCVLGTVPLRASASGGRLLVRPEQIRVLPPHQTSGVAARIVGRLYLGADIELRLRVGDHEVRARVRASEVSASDEVRLELIGTAVLLP